MIESIWIFLFQKYGKSKISCTQHKPLYFRRAQKIAIYKIHSIKSYTFRNPLALNSKKKISLYLDFCPDPESSSGWLSDFKDDSVLGSCTENCFTDLDCRDNELCCANECGGHYCFRRKSVSINSQQRSLCHNADIVLKCFYENMKQKVCVPPVLEPSISF